MTQRPDVEFLGADPDDGTDEELPQLPVRSRPWMARVAVAVVALVVAGLAVRAATDRPHSPVAATKTVIAPVPRTSAPNDPGYFPHRDAVEAVTPKLLVPPACPAAGDGQAACSTTHRLPKAFLAAVRAQFPKARTISTITQVVRPSGAEEVHGLWSRQFTAEVGIMILHVTLSAGVASTLMDSTSFDDGISVRSASWYRAGPLGVQVFTSGPSGHETPFVKLGLLARDPRLLLIT